MYRATDSQTGAQVAYKIVASDVLPNPATLARAERELKQLMRVQSPRIASVIDCGTDRRTNACTWRWSCARASRSTGCCGAARWPLDQAKAIVAQIGQALLEAQKAGIVHRDVVAQERPDRARRAT